MISLDYRRTVLLIIQESSVQEIFLVAGGLPYALSKLEEQKQDPPTPGDLRLVELIMQKITSSHTDALKTMYDNAVLWRKADLWEQVVTVYMAAPSLANTYVMFAQAVKVFGFVNTRLM